MDVDVASASIHPLLHGLSAVGVQCPFSSSLGEFPCYWVWLWYPGLSPVLVSITFPFFSFIHSFILAISIAPLQVLYHSEALPTTARTLYRSFTPKRTGNCR